MLNNAPSLQEIEDKIVELAKSQMLHTVSLYVKSEIYFQAGNFDISPKITIDQSTSISDIKTAMNHRKDELIAGFNTNFEESRIESRLVIWNTLLENSIANGWSAEGRKFFVGKRLLKELQNWLFGTKNILLWEHIIDSDDEHCIEACKELREILNKI